MESYFGLSSAGLKEKFKNKLQQASKYIPKDFVSKASSVIKKGSKNASSHKYFILYYNSTLMTGYQDGTLGENPHNKNSQQNHHHLDEDFVEVEVEVGDQNFAIDISNKRKGSAIITSKYDKKAALKKNKEKPEKQGRRKSAAADNRSGEKSSEGEESKSQQDSQDDESRSDSYTQSSGSNSDYPTGSKRINLIDQNVAIFLINQLQK